MADKVRVTAICIVLVEEGLSHLIGNRLCVIRPELTNMSLALNVCFTVSSIDALFPPKDQLSRPCFAFWSSVL